jgi:hypothetical protein
LQDLTADAFACPGGMDEECSNFWWVKVWVEEPIAFLCFAFAQSATADDLTCIFGDEVGLILDELSIDAKDDS